MTVIIGTLNPETLLGTIGADALHALAGDDAVYGYDGNDLVDGGDGDDFLYGGSGDDTLIGGNGDDVIYAGSGNDTLIGGAGEDFFFGQSGIDTASYATSATGFLLNLTDTSLSTGDARGDFFFSVERFVLGNFNDTLVGSFMADDAGGGNGNDSLSGLDGSDTLSGDGGNDTLDGGQGGDVLIGGSGVDFASYASSSSGITLDLTTPGNSTGDAVGDSYAGIEGLALSGFDDILRLGGTFRRGDGGAGNDDLTGGTAADTLMGGADNDTLTGGNGADLLDGGTGDDSLFGGSGADTFIGGAGADTVLYLATVRVNMSNPANGLGEAKGDSFSGIEQLAFDGTGSIYVGDLTVALLGATMTCIAGIGQEEFLGSGRMSVSYLPSASSVTFIGLGATLFGHGGAAEGDQLTGVASLTLTSFGDTLDLTSFFSSVPSTILAGNGDDTLILKLDSAVLIDGGIGNDDISGHLNAGMVSGGAGNDAITIGYVGVAGGDATISGGSGSDTISVSDYLNADIDAGTGNDSVDIIGLGTSHVTVVAGSGADTVTGFGTFFDVDAGTGNDSVSVSVLTTVGSVVSLSGGDGNDVIGFAVTGASGEAALGFLNGGLGNDHLTAVTDVSDHILTTFVFDANWGLDTVTGFLDGTDLIEFHATGADQFADLTVTGDALHTLIHFGLNRITLDGIDVANFTASDVLFT